MSKHHTHHHHHHHHHRDKKDERYRYTFFLTVLSAVLNTVLAVTKIVVGKFAASHALFADGLHSLSDLLTDTLVFYAAKISHQDADENHPYGHERFETAGTLLVSLLLVVTGLGILLDVMEQVGHVDKPDPHLSALVVIVFSIVTNEFLFYVTRFYAKRIDSELLLANAWHHRSDAWSSLIVLFGLIASYYGYPVLDLMAAVIIACMIIKMGVDLSWNSVKELVDTAVEPEIQQEIKRVITAVPGVEELHQLRTRRMGNNILVDVHLIVSPRITVSEGHFVGDQVQKELRRKIHHIHDVVVHIDPEDDEKNKSSSALSSREDILVELKEILAKEIADATLDDLRIHYLNGQIELELVCSVGVYSGKVSIERLEQTILESLSHSIQEVRKVSLFFK